jgi:protein-disulfide isomerase
VSYRHVIQQYSPEWLAIAVRGFNFKVLTGRMMYEVETKQTQTDQIDESRIREIVLQVIRENPELIQKTLNNYTRTKRIEGQKRQLEAGFNNRITDIKVGSSPTRGPKDADITIFAFQDFECPYSQRGAQTLEPLLKQYTGKTRLVFKNKPQTFHKQAAAAAKAALAAHEQGRFWEYHDLLFKNYTTLGDEVFVKLAGELNLDIERFNKDRNSKTVEDRLNADIAEAEKHNFRGTPTFVMNGVVVAGAQPQPYFNNVIKRLLEQ